MASLSLARRPSLALRRRRNDYRLFRDYPRVRVAKQPKKRLPTNSFDFACNVIDYSTLTSGDIIEPAREQLFGQAGLP